MERLDTDTAADPTALSNALQPASGKWKRYEHTGGIIEYRLPDPDGMCAVAKVTARPAYLTDAAVQIKPTRGCSGGETVQFETIEAAATEVQAELDTVSERIDSASNESYP